MWGAQRQNVTKSYARRQAVGRSALAEHLLFGRRLVGVGCLGDASSCWRHHGPKGWLVTGSSYPSTTIRLAPLSSPPPFRHQGQQQGRHPPSLRQVSKASPHADRFFKDVLVPVIGGLGLFMLGLELMPDGIQKLAVNGLRDLLARIAGPRSRGYWRAR